jgi:Asp/Glu/hydantoin racemase
MSKYLDYYGYINDENSQRVFHANPGQDANGQPIGILVVDMSMPVLPGHVSNAYTYTFPVRYLPVPNVNWPLLHTASSEIMQDIINAARQLEREGCRAVFGDCGFFGHFQRAVADALDIPVFLSSVMQVHMIISGLSKNRRVGVLTANSESLTQSLFESCGVSRDDYERCDIVGAQDEPEFSNVLNSRGYYDVGKVRQELINLARSLVADHVEIGALLLECTDMTQHASALQASVKLPVFDMVTLINYAYGAVCRKPAVGGFC